MKNALCYAFGLILSNVVYTLAGGAKNGPNGGLFGQKYTLSAGISGQDGPLMTMVRDEIDGPPAASPHEPWSSKDHPDGVLSSHSDDYGTDYDTESSGDVAENIAENDQVTILDPAYIKRVELELRMTYGEHEVIYFRNMLKEFQRTFDKESMHPLVDDVTEDHMKKHFEDKYLKDYKTLDDQSVVSDDLRTARMVVKLIKSEFAKFGEIQKKYLEPNIERFTQIKAIADSFGENTDTPCRTEAGCKRLEMLINLCTYIRGGTQFAYDIFATMVHVLGSMLSVLCGCVFIGPVHVCFLKNFPYTCRIPYPVFTSLFQGTTSIWQLVKTTTSICRIYADPGFGSKFG